MLSRALKMTFWVTYDHLGKLLVANLIWAIGITLPGVFALTAFNSGDPLVILAAGLPFLYLALGVIGPILTAAMAHMAKVLIETGDGSMGDLLEGLIKHWKKAWALGTIFFVATGIAGTSVWFYSSQLSGDIAWLGFAASALAMWALLFIILCAVMVMPTLVQKRASVLATLKLTALLVLDNPLLTIGVAIHWAAMLVLAVVMVPIFFGLYGAVCTVLSSCAYEVLHRKYAAKDATPHRRDEDDDYLNRGFKDFLFPWKG